MMVLLLLPVSGYTEEMTQQVIIPVERGEGENTQKSPFKFVSTAAELCSRYANTLLTKSSLRKKWVKKNRPLHAAASLPCDTGAFPRSVARVLGGAPQQSTRGRKEPLTRCGWECGIGVRSGALRVFWGGSVPPLSSVLRTLLRLREQTEAMRLPPLNTCRPPPRCPAHTRGTGAGGREGEGESRGGSAVVVAALERLQWGCEVGMFRSHFHASPAASVFISRSVPNSHTKLLLTVISRRWLVEPGASAVAIGRSEPRGREATQSGESVVDAPPPLLPQNLQIYGKYIRFYKFL